MMHRLAINPSPAVNLQNLAESRKSQSAPSSLSTTAAAGAAPAAAKSTDSYNFAAIFGAASDERGVATASTGAAAVGMPPAKVQSPGGFTTAIADATAKVLVKPSVAPIVIDSQAPVTTDNTTATETTTTTAAASTSAAAETTGAAAAVTTPTLTTPSSGTGIQALVTSIMNGSFQPTSVTNPAQLQEINPAGTDYMPNFYYASDQTASQLASMLGGTVVKMPPFGQDQGWTEPLANFIALPNGQTFNAADVAYYAKAGNTGSAQLTADITATINQGAAWTKYYQTGGSMPSFPEGYVGPPISGMTYSASMIDASGNVINPAMQSTATQGS